MSENNEAGAGAEVERVSVTITADSVLVNTTVCTKGCVVSVPQRLADWLVREQIAVPGGSGVAPAAAAPRATELADWPAGDALAAAGVTTRKELEATIAAGGDSWFVEIEGVGKASAAKIIERLTAGE